MASIKFQKPSLFRKDMDAVLQTMVDEKIGPGEKKRQFSRDFSLYLNRKDGFTFRSYLDAIIVGLSSFNLNSGDYVALSVFTPSIYLEALKRLDLKPFIVDVDSEMMIDQNTIASSLDKEIKAIISFHPICQIPSSLSLRELSLPILEDISQSLGSRLGELKSGSCGDVVICSTEEDSIISTAGGALLFTDNDEYSERIKKTISDIQPFIEMPDLNASLGVVQLANIDQLLQRRNTLYKLYFEDVRKKGNVKVFGSGSIDFFSNGYGFSIISNEKPEEIINTALKYQVTCRKTFSKAIGARYLDKYDKYPKALPSLCRAISFPLYPFLSKEDIQTIEKVIGILR